MMSSNRNWAIEDIESAFESTERLLSKSDAREFRTVEESSEFIALQGQQLRLLVMMLKNQNGGLRPLMLTEMFVVRAALSKVVADSSAGVVYEKTYEAVDALLVEATGLINK